MRGFSRKQGITSNSLSEDALLHHTSALTLRFDPAAPAYMLEPGLPEPGWAILLRPPSFQSHQAGTGILTCFPSTTPLGLVLGPG